MRTEAAHFLGGSLKSTLASKLIRVSVCFVGVAAALIVVAWGSKELIYLSHQTNAKKLPHPLFVAMRGTDEPLVLVHGLVGSHRYWNEQIKSLSLDYKVIAPDLLGFGRSPWPNINYTTKEHLAPLSRTISEILPATEKLILVGHSLGAIIALKYARENPDRINKLILASPPFFSSRKEAERRLKDSSTLESVMSLNSIIAPILCHFHQALGPAAIPLFRPFLKHFPEAVIEDAVLHTWKSFYGSLENTIIGATIFDDLDKIPSHKVLVLLGDSDKDQSTGDIERLKTLGIRVIKIKGSHNFPVEDSENTTHLIRSFISDKIL